MSSIKKSTVISGLMGDSHIRLIMKLLNSKGGEARFVGGAVRDLLLGKPIKDIDIACTFPPDQVMAILSEHHIQVIPTGIAHGTVTAVYEGKHVEITTLRRDVKTDGRHAEVAFTDNWHEDAARRDFTVNAISCKTDGTLYDYFGGMADIRQRRLRFIGLPDERINEDALRILRFFRFAATYEFRMEEGAVNACLKYKHLLKNLSAERIQAEMMKLLGAVDPYDALIVMWNGGVFEQLFPCNAIPLNLGYLIQLEKELCLPARPLRRLAMMLRADKQSDKKAVDKLAEQWKFSNAMHHVLQQLVFQPYPIDEKMAPGLQKKTIIEGDRYLFIEQIILTWAEQLATDKFDQSLLRPAYCTMMLFAEYWPAPVFPVTGEDLKGLGITEGKDMGKWLKQCKEWWHESDYSLSKEQILGRLKGELVS